MTKLNSNSRPKVKRDTFYLPDPEGGVYFRNNVNSFRMEGRTIYQWIEKLMPMFNGKRTLEELTEGLTAPYRNRVYEIGETLYKNGFVRDTSRDRPHQLNSILLDKYASQIEFIENFVDSGAYLFQEYRHAKVLAIGSGSFIVSLASALIESGLPKFDFILTESVPTNRQRLHDLVKNAKEADSEVEVKEIPFKKGEDISFWKQVVQPYDWILYVSQDGNTNELRTLNLVCKEEKKVFLPAVCLDQVGLAGPLVSSESDGCWESAWRRIHQTALQGDRQLNNFSSTTGSILANVLVFEFFKKATEIADSNQSNQVYLLDLETLEGDWISFISHPLVTSKTMTPKLVEDLDLRIKQKLDRNDSSRNLLEYFSHLTSEEIGVFHTWEERDLKQLPLSQCYVQAVNPLSEGPADLLPEVICSGITHEEAKREAGLTGIEMYVSQMVDSQGKGFIGIGAGGTIEEAVCRGLQVYLDEELRKREADQLNPFFHLQLGSVEDRPCRFYLNALTTLNGSPVIGLKEDILGFPVIWVRSNGRCYTRAGLNITLALRNTLQQALLDIQNQKNSAERQGLESAVFLEKRETTLEIPACDEMTQWMLLQSSIQSLTQHSKRLYVYDLTFETFLKQELAGVFGVQVREEES